MVKFRKITDNGIYLSNGVETINATPLVMLGRVLPQIVKFGEKDDIALARCVKILLSCGIDIDEARSSLMTSVKLASDAGHSETVKLLLINILNKNVINQEQNTVRSEEYKAELTSVCRKLSEEDRRFIINSVRERRCNIERLFEDSASLENGLSSDSEIPIALGAPDTQSNEMGTNANANVMIPNNMTELSKCLAEENGHADVVQMLLRRSDIEVNMYTHNVHEVLYLAARSGNIDVVRLLLIRMVLMLIFIED